MDPATRAALRADPRLSRFDPLGRVRHFGGFLRLLARIPPRASIKALVTLMLKE